MPGTGETDSADGPTGVREVWRAVSAGAASEEGTTVSEPMSILGPCTLFPFDNLVTRMREVCYQLATNGIAATHVLSAAQPLAGYESLVFGGADPAMTTFKNLPLLFDATIPDRQMWFCRGQEVVGKLTHIS